MTPTPRHQFASDNTPAICPPAWAALVEANADGVASYGEDEWTRRVCDRVREIFETDCEVFLVFSGTAANALALAQLGRSFQSVLCHENAHIHTDECGAPEFFGGGLKLLSTPGANGKIDLAQVEAMIALQPELHAPKHAHAVAHAYRIDVATLRFIANSHELTVRLPQEVLATPFEIWSDGRMALAQFVTRAAVP